jgi:hypothetical protein
LNMLAFELIGMGMMTLFFGALVSGQKKVNR